MNVSKLERLSNTSASLYQATECDCKVIKSLTCTHFNIHSIHHPTQLFYYFSL